MYSIMYRNGKSMFVGLFPRFFLSSTLLLPTPTPPSLYRFSFGSLLSLFSAVKCSPLVVGLLMLQWLSCCSFYLVASFHSSLFACYSRSIHRTCVALLVHTPIYSHRFGTPRVLPLLRVLYISTSASPRPLSLSHGLCLCLHSLPSGILVCFCSPLVGTSLRYPQRDGLFAYFSCCVLSFPVMMLVTIPTRLTDYRLWKPLPSLFFLYFACAVFHFHVWLRSGALPTSPLCLVCFLLFSHVAL